MDRRRFHDAGRFALEVARDGALSDPSLEIPAAIRRVLGFRRLSASTYAAIMGAVDEHPEFRERVAELADVESVGEAGLLWLTRPEGWQDAVEALPPDHLEGEALAKKVARMTREREGAERTAARAHQDAARADAARKKAEERLAEVSERAGRDSAAIVDLREQLDLLKDERNAAVRALKAVEADLANARHDLKTSRLATAEAEAELAAVRSEEAVRQEAANQAVGARLEGPVSTAEQSDRWEGREAVGHAVSAAAEAAAALAEALNQASHALRTGSSQDDLSAGPGPMADEHQLAHPNGAGSQSAASRGRRRRRPALPFGVFDGTAQAHRHLVNSRHHLIIVDGYNLARTAWFNLDPAEDRRRCVALLEELQARTGGDVVVVFDGQDDTVAPTASRRVQVRYSPTMVTADEVILEIVSGLPIDRAVVVVSSDREVADGARARGAAALSSSDFLVAARRR